MTRAFATIQDGQIELDAPVDWPDGTRIEVRPIEVAAKDPASATRPVRGIRGEFRSALFAPTRVGLDESWWPLSPEEIELLLAYMDAAEPLEMTDEEQSRWVTERAETKRIQQELSSRNAESLEHLFQ
jgi:hypothetical protein